MKSSRFSALLLAVFMPVVLAAPDGELSLDQLVARLASSDPRQREDAAEQLLSKGAEARAAVMRGVRSEDPQLRGAAARILLQLPWYTPQDPPTVRRLLEPYGQLDVQRRILVVRQLTQPASQGWEALLRLIIEEPSDQVKWAIVRGVRASYRDSILQKVRQLPTAGQVSAPLLAAAGHAWFGSDMGRAGLLLRAAIDADARQPVDDGGELVTVYSRVGHWLLLQGRYDEMAALLRQRIARRPVGDENRYAAEGPAPPPLGVLELFALHARFGPVSGFEQDLGRYADWLGDPRLIYCIAKTYERSDRRAMAEATARAGKLMAMTSADTRFEVAQFAFSRGWHDLAEAELVAVLSLSTRRAGLTHASACQQLSMVAQLRDDDMEAAARHEEAVKRHGAAGERLEEGAERQHWQEIHWRYLRAARRRGDRAEAARRLDELMKDSAWLGGAPVAVDIVNDLVPLLREQGRDKEARELFDRMYEVLNQRVQAEPDHPTGKNNLAWLCARCGENKGQALELAKSASAAWPDNPNFMDTLAEAHYQLGQYQEAVGVEKKAMLVRPGDRFLESQLRRFEQAAGGAGTVQTPR